MYNIYFDRRILRVCELNNNSTYNPNAVELLNAENSSFAGIPEFFESAKKINLLYISVPDNKVEHTFNEICSQFTQINAGGGLIQNGQGEYLLILRNGLWDLPKGKQEPNEDIKNTAEREVMEECGISNLEIEQLLCITHHTYHLNNKFMLKHTYWYKMKYVEGEIPTPQTEENIQKCEWVKHCDLENYLKDTYPSIKQVFSAAGLI